MKNDVRRVYYWNNAVPYTVYICILYCIYDWFHKSAGSLWLFDCNTGKFNTIGVRCLQLWICALYGKCMEDFITFFFCKECYSISFISLFYLYDNLDLCQK